MNSRNEIEHYYKNGNRFFRNIDFRIGESFEKSDFENAIFEYCNFVGNFKKSNFKETKFFKCKLISTKFIDCDFSSAEIIDCIIEKTSFKGSKITNLKFKNNTSFGKKVKLNSKTLTIEYPVHQLNAELYKHVPEFKKIADHSDDEYLYAVFGDLSIVLEKGIIEDKNNNTLIKKSFKFFNYLGEKNEKEIDNLLVIGVYEGLYHCGKCNEIAKKLLNGRAKKLYEKHFNR